jgi:hypothetical protein
MLMDKIKDIERLRKVRYFFISGYPLFFQELF